MLPRTLHQIAKAEPRIAALLHEVAVMTPQDDPWESAESLMRLVADIFEDDDTISVSDYYAVKLHIADTLSAKGGAK